MRDRPCGGEQRKFNKMVLTDNLSSREEEGGPEEGKKDKEADYHDEEFNYADEADDDYADEADDEEEADYADEADDEEEVKHTIEVDDDYANQRGTDDENEEPDGDVIDTDEESKTNKSEIATEKLALTRLARDIPAGHALYDRVRKHLNTFYTEVEDKKRDGTKSTSLANFHVIRTVRDRCNRANQAYKAGEAWEGKLPDKSYFLAGRMVSRRGQVNATAAGFLAKVRRLDLYQALAVEDAVRSNDLDLTLLQNTATTGSANTMAIQGIESRLNIVEGRDQDSADADKVQQILVTLIAKTKDLQEQLATFAAKAEVDKIEATVDKNYTSLQWELDELRKQAANDQARAERAAAPKRRAEVMDVDDPPPAKRLGTARPRAVATSTRMRSKASRKASGKASGTLGKAPTEAHYKLPATRTKTGIAIDLDDLMAQLE